ncbi:MAG: hypothetical protein HYY04_09130 [Chloroflexi bacterium]|nr:hypothetical protein [Chloroflexota bacterium]
MPTARRYLGAAAASNGRIYAIGGYNGSTLATVEEYDPATNTWTTRASMLIGRWGLAVVAASNGRIYAIGGYLNSIVEEYDPATDAWTIRESMPTARFGLAAAATNDGRIFAIGGMGTAFSTLDTVEEAVLPVLPATPTPTPTPCAPTCTPTPTARG